jgi:hypothetical protein
MVSFATHYPSPLERQFTRFYSERAQYAHLHKNKSVTIVGLSAAHPLVTAGSIVKVEYSKAALSNEALGKRKRGALGLRADTLLCNITTEDGKIHRIDACVNIDLVEINLRLATDPQLLSQDPEGAGFLCIGLTRAQTDLEKCFPGFSLGGDVLKFRSAIS